VQLNETSERYRIEVYDGATKKRTIEASTPSFRYLHSDRASDGFGAGSSIHLKIAQYSSKFGFGSAAGHFIHI
jgi:hypothetical protein